MMNRLYLLLLVVFATCQRPAYAQFSSVAAHITYGTSIPAHCKPGTGDIFFKTTATVGPYYCSATDTWTFFGTAGGSGAVNGPGSTSDSAVALWDGTSGTLLKNSSLFFDGTTLSGAATISTGDGTVAGCATWKELAANGTNFRKWCSPDSLTADLTINWADSLPTAGQIMAFSAPVAGVSTQSWVTNAAGGTIPSVTTALKGDGAGNAADSKITLTTPATGATLTIPDGVTLTGPAASGTVMALNQTNTGTSAIKVDLNAATGSNAFRVPVKAFSGGEISANGAIAYNSTTDMFFSGRGSSQEQIPTVLAGTSVTTNDCVKFNKSGSTVTLTTAGAACGAGGGATIPSVTNIIKGDGAGNGADTKVAITSPTTAGTLVFGTDNATLTFPGTGTLVTKTSTDTLTNKTYDTAGSGNSFSINGVAVTANTGTGAVVRDTSPTIVTPTIASLVNATHTHANAAGGGQLGVTAVSATGTPSSTTFWRGDNTWSTPAGGSPLGVGWGYDNGTTVTTGGTNLCTVSVPANTLGTGGTSGHALRLTFALVNLGGSAIDIAVFYGTSVNTIATGSATGSSIGFGGEYILANDLTSTTAQTLTYVSQWASSGAVQFTTALANSIFEPNQNSASGTLTFGVKATAQSGTDVVRVFMCSIILQ